MMLVWNSQREWTDDASCLTTRSIHINTNLGAGGPGVRPNVAQEPSFHELGSRLDVGTIRKCYIFNKFSVHSSEKKKKIRSRHRLSFRTSTRKMKNIKMWRESFVAMRTKKITLLVSPVLKKTFWIKQGIYSLDKSELRKIQLLLLSRSFFLWFLDFSSSLQSFLLPL